MSVPARRADYCASALPATATATPVPDVRASAALMKSGRPDSDRAANGALRLSASGAA